MKRVWIAVLMIVGLVLLPGATVVPTPHLPATATLLFNRAAVCTPGASPNLYMQGFDLNGDGEGAEVMVYGSIRPDGTFAPPLLWLFYDEKTGDVAYAILTLPKESALKLSLDELKALYPRPCDLLGPTQKGA